jgi:aquaporin Z
MSIFTRCGVEFLGTFIFISVILSTGQPIPIAVTLLAVMYFGGSISGGHFNPAVSVAMVWEGAILRHEGSLYILAQLAGAFAAYMFVNKVVKTRKL